MKQIVEFPLKEGGTIMVQVDEPEPAGGTLPVGRPGKITETARLTFEEAVGKIRPASERIITTLRDLVHPPNEIGVEFGLNLNAEAGAFIASVGTEANFKVTMTWKQEKPGLVRNE